MLKKEGMIIGMLISDGVVKKNKAVEFRSTDIHKVKHFYSLVKEVYGLEGKVVKRSKVHCLGYTPTLIRLISNRWGNFTGKNITEKMQKASELMAGVKKNEMLSQNPQVLDSLKIMLNRVRAQTDETLAYDHFGNRVGQI